LPEGSLRLFLSFLFSQNNYGCWGHCVCTLVSFCIEPRSHLMSFYPKRAILSAMMWLATRGRRDRPAAGLRSQTFAKPPFPASRRVRIQGAPLPCPRLLEIAPSYLDVGISLLPPSVGHLGLGDYKMSANMLPNAANLVRPRLRAAAALHEGPIPLHVSVSDPPLRVMAVSSCRAVGHVALAYSVSFLLRSALQISVLALVLHAALAGWLGDAGSGPDLLRHFCFRKLSLS